MHSRPWALAAASLGFVAIPDASAQSVIALPQRLLAPAEGEIRCVGDVDGDGDADLVVFRNSAPVEFRAWLNHGDGTFAQGPLHLAPAGSLGEPPELADVTGDGLPDIVVTVSISSPSPSYLRVYRNLGGGSFLKAGIDPVLAGFPLGHVTTDRDGDGLADVFVMADATQTASWFTWDGSAMVESPRLALPGIFVTSLETADWNGDGLRDALVGSWFTPEMRVVLSTPGSLTLGPTISLPGPVGSGRHLARGDLDGDGDEDLLAVGIDNATGGWFWTIEKSAGGYVVAPVQHFPQYSSVWSSKCVLGDWDGDGDLDVALEYWSVRQLRNDGPAGFTPIGDIALDYDGEAIGFADLDQDGALDYASKRSILFGNGTYFDTFTPVFAGALQFPYRMADVEGDGDLDAIDAIGRIAINDATGRFTTRTGVWPSPPAGHFYDDAAAIGDFTGDGLPDYLVQYFELIPAFPSPIAVFREMRVLRDDGLGNYVDNGPAAIAGSVILTLDELRTPVVDLDADGDLDIPTAAGVWANDGNGFFTIASPAFGSGYAVDAGDVDLDGDIDLLTKNLSIVLERRQNTTAIAFSSETLPLALGNTAQLVDVDADSDPDVVCTPFTGLATQILRNVGGTLNGIVTVPKTQDTADEFDAQDVDGDGIVDLLAAPRHENSNGEFVQFYRRTGGFDYEAPRSFIASPVTTFADVDGDGDRDAVGRSVAKLWRWDGEAAGLIRQYGAGKPGAGGAVPVVGASGPLRVASPTSAIHVRRVVGGAPAFLVAGLAETALAGTVHPALTLYTFPWVTFVPLPPAGAPGVPGAGGLDAPFPVLPTMAGVAVFAQVVAIDPAAAGGLTHSNGVELGFAQ